MIVAGARPSPPPPPPEEEEVESPETESSPGKTPEVPIRTADPTSPDSYQDSKAGAGARLLGLAVGGGPLARALFGEQLVPPREFNPDDEVGRVSAEHEQVG